MSPETRNASLGEAGVADFVKSCPATDYPHHSQNVISIQAARLRRRFILSDELALAVASLAFAVGGRR